MPRTSPKERRAAIAARKRRPTLGSGAIVTAALRIVDTEGVDAVSMRRVAAEFDTGPASLYAYFPNKDALLRAVLERVFEELVLPPAGQDWQNTLREFAFAAREVYSRHRDIVRLVFGLPPDTPTALAGGELLLRSMLNGGVPAQTAAWALDVISLYVVADAYEGYLLGQMFDDGSGRPPEEVGRAYFEDFGRRMRSLPPETYPTLAEHAPALIAGNGDERFTFGIETLIAGIAAQVGGGPPRGSMSG